MTDSIFQHWTTYPKIHAPFKRHQSGPTKGRFITNAWSLPEFDYLADNEWTFTEKIDGTNVKIGVVRHEDGSVSSRIGGKTDNAQLPSDLHARLVVYAEKIADWIRLTWDSPGEMIFYGEGYGPKIQNGGWYRNDIDVIFFDIWANGFWLERINVNNICEAIGLAAVPVMYQATLNDLMWRIAYRQKPVLSHVASSDHPLEGWVGVPSCSLLSRNGSRIITKVKLVDFREKD